MWQHVPKDSIIGLPLFNFYFNSQIQQLKNIIA